MSNSRNETALGPVMAVAAPIREQVYRALREAIVTGVLEPGERLKERVLCEQLGASRTSLREALRQLEADGLVENLPRRGPIVAVLSDEDARQIYEVRIALERLIFELFAERATDEEVVALRRAERAFRRVARDPARRVAAKSVFYDTVLRGCRNEVARSVLDGLHDRIAALRAKTMALEGRIEHTLNELDEMVSCVERRDAVAAGAAAAQHVRNAQELLFARVPRGQGAVG